MKRSDSDLGETKSVRAFVVLAALVLEGGCAAGRSTTPPPGSPTPATLSTTPFPTTAIEITLHHSLTHDEAARAGEELGRSLERLGLTWSWTGSEGERDTLAWRVERGLLRGTEGELVPDSPRGSVTARIRRAPTLLPEALVRGAAERRLRRYFPF